MFEALCSLLGVRDRNGESLLLATYDEAELDCDALNFLTVRSDGGSGEREAN